MAVKSTPIGGSAGTLPEEIRAELAKDWTDPRIKEGQIDPETGQAYYSEVQLPMGVDKTFRSNRAFDALEVVKPLAGTRKGYKVGSKTEVVTIEDVPAVPEVLDDNGKVVTPAVDAVTHEVLVIRTMWKPVA